MSTESLGGHGLADRQDCFHLRSTVTGHARFYKGNTAQFPPDGLSTAPAAAAQQLRCQNAR